MTILNLASSKPHVTHQDSSQLEIDANFTRLHCQNLDTFNRNVKKKKY